MDWVLWALQVILAIKCLSTAFIHAFRHDKDSLRQAMQRLGSTSRFILNVAAILMVICSLGLTLPVALGFLPWLTPLSAAILAGMLLLSIPLHVKSRDKPMVFVSIILLVLCAIVIYGRWIMSV